MLQTWFYSHTEYHQYYQEDLQWGFYPSLVAMLSRISYPYPRRDAIPDGIFLLKLLFYDRVLRLGVLTYGCIQLCVINISNVFYSYTEYMNSLNASTSSISDMVAFVGAFVLHGHINRPLFSVWRLPTLLFGAERGLILCHDMP